MERKNITLYFVDHESGASRKIILSTTALKLALMASGLVVMIFVAGLVDYFGLVLEALENKKLEAENVQLRMQFEMVEGKLNSLENSLERVKTFTNKLKLITNIETEDRVTKLTMGTKPAPGQNVEEYEPMNQRLSSVEMAQQDQMFPRIKTIDEEKGNVSEQNSTQDYSTLVIRIDKAVRETQLKEQSVIELWESLSERQSLLNATPNIKPARGWLTSKFGYRLNPFTNKMQMHAGLDIAAAPGSPVYSPADGVVIFASYDETYGKLVSIDHGYGVTTRFAHNSQIYVSLGQKVTKYDVIASVGNTGRSTGPHLHYEVRINGTPVDPINFILDE
jgi:murein DD-endopeptidase MepM/ murein hydrolase activator NlpD